MKLCLNLIHKKINHSVKSQKNQKKKANLLPTLKIFQLEKNKKEYQLRKVYQKPSHLKDQHQPELMNLHSR